MFNKLLVPLDQSALAEQALGAAADLARPAHAELDLVLVHHPVPFPAVVGRTWNHAHATQEETYLARIAREVTGRTGVRITHGVMRGAPAEMICRRAILGGVDLIVMTSHGRTGVKRASLGSVADAVVHESPIPVLVLRPKDDPSASPPPVRRMLIPLDGSALAMEILLPALALAQCSDATVVLLRVVPPVPALAGDAAWDDAATEQLAIDARERLAGAARCLRERGMTSIECEVVVRAHVADAIVEFALAHAIDLIALSTHGRGASRLVVGSVADAVLTQTSLPLLVHHPLAVLANEGSIGAEGVAAQLPSLSDW